MSVEKVRVQCTNRLKWGRQIFGSITGAVYSIVDGGELQLDGQPGVLAADAEKLSRAPGYVLVAGGGAEDASREPHTLDASVAPPPPPAPPPPLELPSSDDTVKVWLDWARKHSIALSATQKTQPKAELLATITQLATKKDAATKA